MLRREITRKGVHLALVFLPILAWMVAADRPRPVRVALLALGGAALAADQARRFVPRLRQAVDALAGPILRPRETPGILGSTLYLISLAGLFWWLPRTTALAAMLFLIFGDAMAAIVGRAFGRLTLRGGKTLEGSLACLASCLLLVPVLRGLDPGIPVRVLLAGAFAATLGEALSPGRLDNLVVPLASGATMHLLTRAA